MKLVSKSSGSNVEFINVVIYDNCSKVYLSCVYNPHKGFSLAPYVEELSSSLINFDYYVICGDFNTNLLAHDTSTSLFLDQFSELGFSVVNNEIPTRFANNSKNSLLDLMIVSDCDQVCRLDQIGFVSDHDLIYCCFNFELTKSPGPPSSISFRDFNSLNRDVLFSALASVPWDHCWFLLTVDEKLEFLTNHIVTIFETCIPLRTVQIKNSSCPWYNKNVIEAIKKRNKLHGIWKKNQNSINWEFYRKARNQATLAVRNSKRAFFCKKLDYTLKSKDMWRNLKRLGVWKNNSVICDIHPERMNDFFVSNASSQNIPPDSVCEVMGKPRVDECFSFRCVDLVEVADAVKKIKSNAVGIDGIPIKFVKLILPYILGTLTHVINHCLTTSSFPSPWKVATVLPLAKISNAIEPSDFRPISILPALSKVMESIMVDELKKHIYGKNLVSPHQSGYREGHSCTTAMLKVLEDIRTPYDQGDLTTLCLLDFSKAFDSVNHQLLCSKLQKYFGFKEDAQRLVGSYLCDRSQRVKVGEEISNLKKLSTGVPQGSLLGPLLFSLFINDIFEVTSHVSMHAYADDIQVYLSGRTGLVVDLFARFDDDLKVISSWATDNFLNLNPVKSIILPITRSKISQLDLQTLYIMDKPLKVVDKAKKYIGTVSMDRNHTR